MSERSAKACARRTPHPAHVWNDGSGVNKGPLRLQLRAECPGVGARAEIEHPPLLHCVSIAFHESDGWTPDRVHVTIAGGQVLDTYGADGDKLLGLSSTITPNQFREGFIFAHALPENLAPNIDGWYANYVDEYGAAYTFTVPIAAVSIESEVRA